MSVRILKRRLGETLIIGGNVEVTVLGVKGNQVRIRTRPHAFPRRGVCRAPRRLGPISLGQGPDECRTQPLGAHDRTARGAFGCAPSLARTLRAYCVRPNSLPANLSWRVCAEQPTPCAGNTGEAGQVSAPHRAIRTSPRPPNVAHR